MSWIKNLFSKDGSTKVAQVQKANIAFAQLNYPTKVILAWIKSIEGNTAIELWLKENGYEEIFYTNMALRLKQEAREWLMTNNYPHLMAFVNAAEGNESAMKWLEIHGFDILNHMAKAIDDEMESFNWLNIHTDEFIFGLTKAIKQLKDRIEFNHNDMYSFRKDE